MNHVKNGKYSDDNFDKIVNIINTEKYLPQGCFNFLIDGRFDYIVFLTLYQLRFQLLFQYSFMKDMEISF